MKHGIFPLIILISIGCGTDTKRPNVTTLSTFKDSTSYALGADLGTNLKQQKVEIEGDQVSISRITTEVKDGKLVIDVGRDFIEKLSAGFDFLSSNNIKI